MNKARLSPLLQEIAEVTNLDVAMKLAEAKGGQRVTIPAKMHEAHWLAKLVGFDHAKELSKYFTHKSSVDLDIPMGHTSSLARRRAKIQKLRGENKSANEIALALGIHRRTVFDNLARIRDAEDGDHPTLFD